MILLSENEICTVFDRFKKQNPDPVSELVWKNAYTLLVSVVLSAQTTDKSVNRATEPLYKIADTPEKMVTLGQQKLEEYIRAIGLYHTKAAHVIELSRMLISDFGSEVPHTREELMTLPGVGRKTANVVLNVVFHQPTMPVDTHLLRICPKIGLAEGTTPAEVEKSLVSRIPSEYMQNAHHWLILHGRYVCTARNPHCDTCLINDICKHNKTEEV
jgi:endonuclease III